ESDTWALWAAGLPALGLPGADSTGCLEKEDLAGIGCVYLIPDDDESGRRFSERILARLRALGWKGRLCVLDLPEGAKDTCALRAADPQAFRHLVTAMRQGARVIEIGGPRPGPSASAKGTPDEPAPLVKRRLSTVKCRPVRWLVRKYIPLG